MCQVLCYVLLFPLIPRATLWGSVIILFYRGRKLRFRKRKQPNQYHTARKWQSLSSNLDLYDSQAYAFNYMILLYISKSMSSDWHFSFCMYTVRILHWNKKSRRYGERSLSTISEKWKRSETWARTGLWTVTAQETACPLSWKPEEATWGRRGLVL